MENNLWLVRTFISKTLNYPENLFDFNPVSDWKPQMAKPEDEVVCYFRKTSR
jgi:hypothetical protein